MDMYRDTRKQSALRTLLFSLCFGVLACSSNPNPKLPNSSAAVAPTKPEDKPLKQFAQEITSERISLQLKSGGQFAVPVTVKNIGTETWHSQGTYPVHLSYLWIADNDNKELPRANARTFLPADLAPGASQSLSAVVLAPSSPGQYTLKFTMVQERVAWFADLHGKTVDIPVTIQ
jgi:hypothetical protein